MFIIKTCELTERHYSNNTIWTQIDVRSQGTDKRVTWDKETRQGFVFRRIYTEQSTNEHKEDPRDKTRQ